MLSPKWALRALIGFMGMHEIVLNWCELTRLDLEAV